MNIRVSDIIYDSIVDGPGLRTTLFVQGCSHHCPGCHNEKTWDPQGGTSKQIAEVISDILSHGNGALTFSGGEPFEQPLACLEIANVLKKNNYNLWAYSGYTYEAILEDPDKLQLLKTLDVLVDGRFILSLKSLSLQFKGSKNQRIIDVQKSLAQNKVVEYNLSPKLTGYQKHPSIHI